MSGAREGRTRERYGRSARHALVIVLRTQLLEERNRLGERLDPLHRPIREIDGRLPRTVDAGDLRALGHEVANHLVVAARGGVVNGSVAVGVDGIDVLAGFLDEVAHG